MTMEMTWVYTMKYFIACLKEGDEDGWAEAQLINLAEELAANGSEIVVELPRHGDSLDIEALAEEVGAHVLYIDEVPE